MARRATKGRRGGTDLQHLLILLRLRLVNLLDSAHVLLEVDDGMFPRLQPLGEEAGSLSRKSDTAPMAATPIDPTYGVGVRVGDGLVARDAGDGLLAGGGPGCCGGGHLCGFWSVVADALFLGSLCKNGARSQPSALYCLCGCCVVSVQ